MRVSTLCVYIYCMCSISKFQQMSLALPGLNLMMGEMRCPGGEGWTTYPKFLWPKVLLNWPETLAPEGMFQDH